MFLQNTSVASTTMDGAWDGSYQLRLWPLRHRECDKFHLVWRCVASVKPTTRSANSSPTAALLVPTLPTRSSLAPVTHLGYFGLSFLLEKYPVFTHWSLQPIISMVHSQVCKLFELRIWFLFQKWPFYKSLDVQNTLPVNLNGPVWAPWQEAVLNQAKIRHFGLMCLKGMSPTIVLDQ